MNGTGAEKLQFFSLTKLIPQFRKWMCFLMYHTYSGKLRHVQNYRYFSAPVT